MQKIPFLVIPPRSTPPSFRPPCFILQQDNWNDYRFMTQYFLTSWSVSADGNIAAGESYGVSGTVFRRNGTGWVAIDSQ